MSASIHDVWRSQSANQEAEPRDGTSLEDSTAGPASPEWEREGFLAFILKIGGLGHWRLDLATGRLDCSEGCKLNFGLGPDARLASFDELREYIHPDDRPQALALVERSITTGADYAADYRVLPPSGELRWVSARGRVLLDPRTGTPGAIAGITLDITDRKVAEAERERLVHALALSEERYRLAALATSDAIWDWDLQSDRVTWNDAVRSTFGYATGEMGQTCEEWAMGIHPEDRDKVLDALKTLMDSGGSHWGAEYRFRKGDGSYADVIDRGYMVSDAKGQQVRMVGAMQDVTERRRQAEFERQLIGIVSHDLRTPLNVITSSAALLGQSAEIPEQHRSAVMRISRSAERATRMIRDLLDFTKARLGGGIPIERRVVDIHELCRQAVDDHREARRGRAIELQTSGDGVGAWDADRLAQVVSNLLDNAVKYSPADEPVRVIVGGDGKGVTLEVRNGGALIAPEMLHSIFEPMQRGGAAPMDKSTRSIGLGLYIVNHLVMAHGGRVDVLSSQPEGTVFRVWLPRVG